MPLKIPKLWSFFQPEREDPKALHDLNLSLDKVYQELYKELEIIDAQQTIDTAAIATNVADIATNVTNITNNDTDIATNVTDITNLDTRITTLEGVDHIHTEISARVSRSTNQSIADGVAEAIEFTAEDWDNGGIADLVSYSTRLTVPAGEGGRYLVSGRMYMDGGSGGQRHLYIEVDGTPDYNFSQFEIGNSTACRLLGSMVFDLSAGSYIELWIYQSGAARNVQAASFGLHKLTETKP